MCGMIYSEYILKGVLITMKKWGKGLFGLASAAGTIAGLIYYLKKKDSSEDDEFEDEFEDNDFDLDSDLKPVSDREYVSLNASKGEEEAENAEAKDAQSSDEEASEEKTEDKEEASGEEEDTEKETSEN